MDNRLNRKKLVKNMSDNERVNYICVVALVAQDGTLKLWNYKSGDLLDDVDCSALLQRAADTDNHASADLDSSYLAFPDSHWHCANSSVVGGDTDGLGYIRCRGADVCCLVYSGRDTKIFAVAFER